MGRRSGRTERVVGELRAALDGAGTLGLDIAPLDEFNAVLETLGDLVVEGGHARPAAAADLLAERGSWPDWLPTVRPRCRRCRPCGTTELIRRGELVQVNAAFVASAIDDAARWWRVCSPTSPTASRWPKPVTAGERPGIRHPRSPDSTKRA